ncbi:hypothetical protein BDY24DRAFT_396907 [Mrakia frigida]|uniref:uncharacterized protein n=1 Tax=Mrakia frigida TaxID=29902 RepID=UPI003FCC1211
MKLEEKREVEIEDIQSESPRAIVPGARIATKNRWTTAEEEDLVRLLDSTSGPQANVFRAFQLQHPSRTFESVKKYYHNHRLLLKTAADALRTTPSFSSSSSSGSSFPPSSSVDSSNMNTISYDDSGTISSSSNQPLKQQTKVWKTVRFSLLSSIFLSNDRRRRTS